MTPAHINGPAEATSPQVVTDALGHLAFCALAALHLARKNGNVNTPYAENLFLLRWLALAQKQKRLTKIVAQDIAWLHERGRRRGTDANLRKHIEYLYRSCTDIIEAQTDLLG